MLVACGLLNLAAVNSRADDLEDAYAKLQGEWKSVSYDVARSPKDSHTLTMIFKEKKLTMKVDDKTYQVDCELNVDEDPKWMDLVTRQGPAIISVNRGIYKLVGGNLTICHGGVDRPSKFEIRPGEYLGDSVIVLTRKR